MTVEKQLSTSQPQDSLIEVAVPPAGGSETPPVSSRTAWTSVAILLLLLIVSILDRQIIALQIEPMKADLGLSDTQIGVLQGIAFALFYVTASLPLGWAVDRYSRRGIAFLGVTIWSLASAGCGLANNFWQLFAGRMLVGVGEATLNPTAVSLIGDLFPSEKTGAPMGAYSAGVYLGSGVALTVGGLVVGLFAGDPVVHFPLIGNVASWQAVFIITGLPGIFLAFAAFLMHDPRPPRRAVARGMKATDSGFIRFAASNVTLLSCTFIGFGLSGFAFYAISAWTPAYLARTFNLPMASIGWTWGLVVASSGALGALGGGVVIDRVYRAGIRDACLVVPAITGLLALPFIAGAYFMPTPSLTLAALGIGLLLFSVAGPSAYATMARMAPRTLRGQVTAGFTLVSGLLASGLGPVSVGLVTDKLLGDEARVGTSIAMVVSLALPIQILLLLTARPLLRKHP